MMTLKLGKRPPVFDDRKLNFGASVAPVLPDFAVRGDSDMFKVPWVVPQMGPVG
jgi:hypothetical protein